VAHRARAALQVDETEALKKCTLPLLFLQATSDRLIRRRSGDLVKEVRPDLPVLPFDAPHFLLQLRPVECLNAIQDFLRETDQ
jgi:pimeloyl-[acyl-carrier protein] methyl ester esterase